MRSCSRQKPFQSKTQKEYDCWSEVLLSCRISAQTDKNWKTSLDHSLMTADPGWSEKGQKKYLFCLVFIYSIKQACEIWKFHLAVVHRHLTNMQKPVMHKFPIVVIQKFCYHALTWRHSSALSITMTHNSTECWSQLK